MGLSSSGSQPAGPPATSGFRTRLGRSRGRAVQELAVGATVVCATRRGRIRPGVARRVNQSWSARLGRRAARRGPKARPARPGTARRVGAARRGPRARPWSGAAAAPNEDLGVGEREDVRVDLAFEPRRGRLAGVPGAGGVGGPRRVRTQCPAHQPTPRPEGRGAPAGTRTGIQDLRQMFGEKCPASKPTPRPKARRTCRNPDGCAGFPEDAWQEAPGFAPGAAA